MDIIPAGPGSVNRGAPAPPRHRGAPRHLHHVEAPVRDLLIGFLLLAGWGVLQFGTATHSGWIHVLLIAGVLLVIRGIALRGEPAPGNGA